MMFKTETHLHTAETSPCSRIGAAEMVRRYKDAGYSTIFVTDHFQLSTIGSYEDATWEEKTKRFLEGYYVAKREGDRIGVNVLLGAEFNFIEAPNDYLAYGISKEFFDKYPDLHTYGIEKFSKVAHENGVFIIQAHPYRDGYGYPTPDYIDAVEVCNTNPRHEDYNEKISAFAKENHLPFSGGSDAHRDADIGRGGIETETEIKTVEEFIDLIKTGNVNVIRGDV